jgi:hypothetical protein
MYHRLQARGTNLAYRADLQGHTQVVILRTLLITCTRQSGLQCSHCPVMRGRHRFEDVKTGPVDLGHASRAKLDPLKNSAVVLSVPGAHVYQMGHRLPASHGSAHASAVNKSIGPPTAISDGPRQPSVVCTGWTNTGRCWYRHEKHRTA